MALATRSGRSRTIEWPRSGNSTSMIELYSNHGPLEFRRQMLCGVRCASIEAPCNPMPMDQGS
jgi:hypothetical protein